MPSAPNDARLEAITRALFSLCGDDDARFAALALVVALRAANGLDGYALRADDAALADAHEIPARAYRAAADVATGGAS